MSRARLELLQWFGLFGGALAWTVQHVVGYGISDAGCSVTGTQWDLDVAALQTALALAAGTVVVLAWAAAFLAYRETRVVDEYATGPVRPHPLLRAGGVARQCPLPRDRRPRRGEFRLSPCRAARREASHAHPAPARGAGTGGDAAERVVAERGAGQRASSPRTARAARPSRAGRARQRARAEGSGALSADFYVRTGYMPLDNPHSQPWRTRVLFSEQEIRSLVAYVASLGHGPAIRRRNGSAQAFRRA